jgi:hypothetical protein
MKKAAFFILGRLTLLGVGGIAGGYMTHLLDGISLGDPLCVKGRDFHGKSLHRESCS